MSYDLSDHSRRMDRDGFTVVTGALTAEECEEGCAQLDRLSADRERGGFELLFNKARVFERLYQIPHVLEVIRYYLGADALLSSMTGSILMPGEGGGGLHADGAITGHNRERSMSAADSGRRITSHVIALNLIWCLSEFTDRNGATMFAAGSHRHHSLDIPEGALDSARPVEAERGSVIVFDVNTWHGPSRNHTDRNRFAVLNPWRRQWTRCEYEIAAVVDPEVLARAGESASVLGVDARPPYVERWQWDRETGAPLPGSTVD
ncbi:MAG: phytanoyl-CoA dioxygenase family protein [Candidatus Latescibacterota bacterium]|nr:phytanoyl-CoA dioxygenase family protein [Candidatus Latescibacterota bacterium]